MINPQELIEKYTLTEHLKFADDYFNDRQNQLHLYQKPFHSPTDSGFLLGNLGQLFNGLDLKSGMKVLDFASGSCWLSKILVEFGCIVTSYDASPKALSIGKALFEKFPPINKKTPPPQFNIFDGKKLNEKNEKFDRIIVNDAFHHIPNTEEILAEFYRVLKPHGIVGMSEPGRQHSQTEASQYEMEVYKVIENDFILENIWNEAQLVGFDRIKISPVLRDRFITLDQYIKLISGDIPKSVQTYLKEDTLNNSLFFLHKDIKATTDNFNEKTYLELNPDVALAVQKGTIESGLQHYRLHGKNEGRKYYSLT